MNKKFDPIDGETLMNASLPPVKFIAESLISQGLHILAGAPKAGKSWLALYLCLQVAKGEPIWGFETEKGKVVYLCLEDSRNRIQSRLQKVTEYAPSTLTFITKSHSITSGMIQELEEFITANPDTTFVVIDTLQKVRDAVGENTYASDYRDLSILKTIADKYGIAILLIHHLRKQRDSDPFNMVSGTTGITGAVDGSFVLERSKRNSEDATLYCTGRDIEYQELKVSFKNHLWNLVSAGSEEPDPIDSTIFLLCNCIKSIGAFKGTISELIEKMNLTDVQPSVLSRKIKKHSDILAKHGVLFEANRSGERREFHLSYVPDDGMTRMTE